MMSRVRVLGPYYAVLDVFRSTESRLLSAQCGLVIWTQKRTFSTF